MMTLATLIAFFLCCIFGLTDFHYDPRFGEGRSCVSKVGTIGPWGTHLCDSKWKLVNSSVYAMRKIEPNPEFILWTGDSALHYLNGTAGTKEEIVKILVQISELIDEVFPNTPVLASFGNHDYVPDNTLPATINDIYVNISQSWNALGWFDKNITTIDEFNAEAYYAVQLPSGLIGVVLNTNFYYRGNSLYNTTQDPGNQFFKLESLLKEARNTGTKVVVSAHVPFGVGATGRYIHMYQQHNAAFLRLQRLYHDVIIGNFFGHEHIDTFKVVYDKDDTDDRTPIVSAFLAPSVTPWKHSTTAHARNPGIRLYTHNGAKVMDYTQYHLNLAKANQGDVQWWKLYTFTEDYQVPDLTAASLHKTALAIQDGSVSKKYFRNYFLGATNLECDASCRHGYVCAITEVSHAGAFRCVENEPISLAVTERASFTFIASIIVCHGLLTAFKFHGAIQLME